MWDFKLRPELPNSMMSSYYFDSPHKQITKDFTAKVVKVTDGDTVRLQWEDRNFDFPLRMLGIDTPEITKGKNEMGGREAQRWLESEILGKEVDIQIDPNQRVGKWGRLLGTIIHDGINMNDQSILEGHAVLFENRRLLDWR